MNDAWFLLITIVLSAFFSGMEIAFISANRLRMEVDKGRDFMNARLLPIFTNNPERFIASMLVGNNIALVIYGLVFARILDPILAKYLETETAVLLTQTLISTVIILFFAEFLPKTIFRVNPNLTLRVFSIPTALFFFVFYPITSLTLWISNRLIKTLFKREIKTDQSQVFGRVDLNALVSEKDAPVGSNTPEEEKEVELFRNALDFSTVKLRECMIPRPEMEAVDITTAIDEIRQRFVETGYSKIVIFEESIDNVIGYIHTSDLFNDPKSVKSILRKAEYVPESMEAQKLLRKFLIQHRSIAIVIDEFGGTAGMVTSEDILEEIFGEIQDEHDTNDLVDQQINDKEYRLSGRHEIDDLNNRYNLHLPEDENYETIAGYIIHHLEDIPATNTTFTIGEIEFKVLRSTNSRIELIHLKFLD